MSEAKLSIRTDPNLKEQAQELFNQMGFDISTAVNIFLRQSVHDQALPFRPSVEDPDSIEARRQAEAGEGKRYVSVSDLMADLDA
ncbi:type II toxin-antitoxin system RelB/DinJ family antitoxin [Parafannyhessea umbonata]|uniref:type II toxin-antitoxin system RelB/DinJ family antitoxin n=1 Tax=Parafannyhessea umbonata TaxID=604330 RepID=UPI003AB4DA51